MGSNALLKKTSQDILAPKSKRQVPKPKGKNKEENAMKMRHSKATLEKLGSELAKVNKQYLILY